MTKRTLLRKPVRRSRNTAAAMDAAEIKVTIRPDQELRALRALELNEDTAEVRILYFYEPLIWSCSTQG